MATLIVPIDEHRVVKVHGGWPKPTLELELVVDGQTVAMGVRPIPELGDVVVECRRIAFAFAAEDGWKAQLVGVGVERCPDGR